MSNHPDEHDSGGDTRRGIMPRLRVALRGDDTLLTSQHHAPAPAAGERTRGASDESPTPDQLARQFRSAPLRRPGGAPVLAQPISDADLDVIPPELRRAFIAETITDLHDLRAALLELERQPGDVAHAQTMGRITHKIKGAAATYGFDVLAELTHTLEDALRALPAATQHSARAAAMEQIITCVGLMEAALEAGARDEPPDAALVRQAEALRARVGTHAPGSMPALAPRPTATEPPLPSASAPDDRPHSTRGADADAAGQSEPPLRVAIQRLDGLMNLVSALATNRATLSDIRAGLATVRDEMDHSMGRLRTICEQLGDAPLGGAALAGTPPPPARWDALGLDRFTEVDQALRSLREAVDDVTTNAGSLRGLLQRLGQASDEHELLMGKMQQDIMQMRLVPLRDLVPRLQLATRRLATQLGKEVVLAVTGELTQIDRNISEALGEPLIQLIHNAVVHGIEAPDERAAAGKPAQGHVWLHAYYAGNEVIVEVGDDGRGVNPHAVLAAAVLADMLDEQEARALSPSQALDLMFLPGLTTVKTPELTGGRGVGLDEVRTAIQALKGQIHVRSVAGRGAVFRVRVPISLSIIRALQIQVGEECFAVPFAAVRRTIALLPGQVLASAPSAAGVIAPPPSAQTDALADVPRRIRVERASDDGHVDGTLPRANQAYEEIPALDLAQLLGLALPRTEPHTALVVETERQQVALLVDEVHHDRELVVRALPRHLRRRYVRGATVTPDGRMLLLLDLPELITGVLHDGPRPHFRAVARPAPPVAPHVLVVDDSSSMRHALHAVLGHAGFTVQVAHDGLEALGLMMTSLPRVIVLDIEMPRLDGFELLGILRERPQFAGVRVALLTSRAAEHHRAHAQALGADAYLVKPCPQDVLVATIQHLANAPVVPTGPDARA